MVKAGPAAEGIVTVSLNGTEIGNVKLDSPASKTVKVSGKDLKKGENVFTVTGAANSGGALVRANVTFTRTDGKLVVARDNGVKVTRTVSVRGADGKWTDLKSGASVPVGSYVKIRVVAMPAAGQLILPARAQARGLRDDPQEITVSRPRAALGHVLREDRRRLPFPLRSVSHATAEFTVLAEFEEYTPPRPAAN